jgi:SAM-dependent methyltransferase
MHLDVTEIRDFYSSRLGQTVRRYICQKIKQHWPDARGSAIAGVGFPTPYLRPYLLEAAQVAAFHPAGQGGMIWPAEGPLRAALVDEDMFPLPDASFDRIIEIHGLEFFSDVEMHLKEIWRIMRPEGRLILIVPNRSGLWAQMDTTPFGHGQPFSRGQLRDLLVRSWFRPLSIEPLVHFAPFETPLRLTASPAIERIGAKVWPRFCGMLMVEAIKEVAQPIRPKGLKVSRLKTSPISIRPVPA